VASGPDFSHTVVSDDSFDAHLTDALPPIVGRDDRLAVHWRETSGHFCDDDRTQRHNFAYTVPGQGMTTTGPGPQGFDASPPDGFQGYWFQCDGQLYFKFRPSGGAFMGTVWDTGVASTCNGPADSDGDGVPDASDNCPAQAGPPSNGGCPASGDGDSDGDGVPDTSDNCPAQAGPASNGGCPVTSAPPPSAACDAARAKLDAAKKKLKRSVKKAAARARAKRRLIQEDAPDPKIERAKAKLKAAKAKVKKGKAKTRKAKATVNTACA
jgi:hypothetical protein